MSIRFSRDKCTGCGACQMACLDQRDIRSELGQKPLRFVEVQEQDGQVFFCSIGCVHCGKCMTVCPQGCISRNDLGYVVLDQENCIGCGRCQGACPFGVISRDQETGNAVKCDGCSGRLREGLLPACVHTCPTGALYMKEMQ